MNTNRINIYLTGLPGSGKTSVSTSLMEQNITPLSMSGTMFTTAQRLYDIIDRKDFGNMSIEQRDIVEETVWKEHIENNDDTCLLVDGHLHIIHDNIVQPAFPYEKFKHIDVIMYIEKTIEHLQACIQERNEILIQKGQSPKKQQSIDELQALDSANKKILTKLQEDDKNVIIISPVDKTLHGLLDTAKREFFKCLGKS